MTEAPNGHDLIHTCPNAGWRGLGEGRAKYGIPGLAPCAVLDHDEPKALTYEWSYVVYCPIAGKRARGRVDDINRGFDEARYWLRAVACPGNHQPFPDALHGPDAPSL